LRFLSVSLVVVAAGCATISGLDALDVDGGIAIDSSIDVAQTTNDATDEPAPLDASPDAQDASSMPDSASTKDSGGDATTNAGKIVCGVKTCAIEAGAFCCVTNNPTCDTQIGSCAIGTDTILMCDDDTDCTGGKECCLSDSYATCSPSCNNEKHLCVPDASTYCVCAPYSITQNEVVGLCQ
jgi:hypothetical protein